MSQYLQLDIKIQIEIIDRKTNIGVVVIDNLQDKVKHVLQQDGERERDLSVVCFGRSASFVHKHGQH